jgi:hypothetical protein
MDNKPKGGRGKQAPYETTIIRIPLPIKPDVERIVENYRSSVNQPILAAIAELEKSPIPLKDAIIKAEEILLDKKASKRVSMKKLLQVIYGQKISL